MIKTNKTINAFPKTFAQRVAAANILVRCKHEDIAAEFYIRFFVDLLVHTAAREQLVRQQR